jgi:uncharacterized membrane protein
MFTLARDRRQLALLGALAFSSGIAVFLYVLRVVHTRSLSHGGMVWNLFLAWLPLIAALAAYNLARRHRRGAWLLVAICAVLWLLFFPNAPYILTDFGNLWPRFNMPFWYDVLMYVAFALSGTFLGLVSLYVMQLIVGRLKGPVASWLFALAALALSAFGVYLGRFPRYNSWDVFTSPQSLLLGIWDRLSNPAANIQMFAFTALFALVLMSAYLMLFAMVQFPPDPKAAQR